MEYCEGGELFNYIVKKRRLNEDEASFFFYQIINGLEYIHSLGIVHRDLKPENLLLGKDQTLKIIDFGLSNYFNKKLLITPCGSPCYASPEMVSGNHYNGFKIDVWSCGIILYAMLCGYLPFEDKDNEVLFKKILKCKLDFPSHLSSLSRDMIKKILVTDPDKRITIPEIKRHPFFLKGKEYFNHQFSFRKHHDELLSLAEEEALIYNAVKTEGDDPKPKTKNKYFYSTLSPPKETNLIETEVKKNSPYKNTVGSHKTSEKFAVTQPSGNHRESSTAKSHLSPSTEKKKSETDTKPHTTKNKNPQPFYGLNLLSFEGSGLNTMRFSLNKGGVSKKQSHKVAPKLANPTALMSIPANKHNSITIKSKVINFYCSEAIKKNLSRTKYQSVNKSDRKKPALKFHDIARDSSPSIKYSEVIVKTQENYQNRGTMNFIKNSQNTEINSMLRPEKYKQDLAIYGNQKHSKINSMKLNGIGFSTTGGAKQRHKNINSLTNNYYSNNSYMNSRASQGYSLTQSKPITTINCTAERITTTKRMQARVLKQIINKKK